MQISRHLLLACAVATCLTPTFLRAYDNEAQIRARQALEEKMNQLDSQPAQTNPPPAAVTKPKPAKKPKVHPAPAPAPAPPMVKSAPAEPPAQPAPSYAPEISQPATPTPTASENSMTSDKLQQALDEKMKETPTAPAAPVAPPAPKPAPPSAPAVVSAPPAEPAPAPAPQDNFAPVPAMDSATSDKLQQALQEKMKQTEPAMYQPVPTVQENHPNITLPPAPAPAVAPTPTSAKNRIQPEINLPPLQGPASPLPAAKQQKLDDLLQLYRADRITPEQYHEQRAKILAEP